MIHPLFMGLLLIIYVLIEIVRYIRYLRIYHMLNRMNRYDLNTYPIEVNSKNREKQTNFDRFLDDMETYPDLLEENLKDVYIKDVNLEDMVTEDVCEALFDLVNRNPKLIKRIKDIVKNLKAHKEKQKRIIFQGNNAGDNERLQLRRSNIRSWFQILPMYFVMKLYDYMINSLMMMIGYRSKTVNGIDIWHNGYDPKRGKPIIFFHASLGGVTLQIATIQRFSGKYNLIMPDIPGMNFSDSGNPPFTMKKVCETVMEFTKKHYSPLFSKSSSRVNLMGHSLGNNFCSYIINTHPNDVDTFFCVEGQIFFHRSLRVYKEFLESIVNMSITEILTFPLLHRDLYAQYFIQRLMRVDESFIFNLDRAPHIKINMYHSKTDSRFLIDSQLKYADLKSIPLDYHIFKGDRSHGAFILDSEFREYVFKQIEIKMD